MNAVVKEQDFSHIHALTYAEHTIAVIWQNNPILRMLKKGLNKTSVVSMRLARFLGVRNSFLVVISLTTIVIIKSINHPLACRLAPEQTAIRLDLVFAGCYLDNLVQVE